MAAGTIRYFEDVTGNLTATVFRDAMNRTSPSNIRISPLVPGLAENQAILEIRRENATLVLLDFSASINSLGLVTFSNSSSATPRKMEQYLWPMRNKRGRMKRFLPTRSTPAHRTFTALDGNDYTWVVRHDVSPTSSPPQAPTFVCSSKDCPIVATYHPLPQPPPTTDGGLSDAPAAVLEIAADSTPLLPELIASLTIMRYIERYPEAQYGVRL